MERGKEDEDKPCRSETPEQGVGGRDGQAGGQSTAAETGLLGEERKRGWPEGRMGRPSRPPGGHST